jgi:hypothetical protein
MHHLALNARFIALSLLHPLLDTFTSWFSFRSFLATPRSRSFASADLKHRSTVPHPSRPPQPTRARSTSVPFTMRNNIQRPAAASSRAVGNKTIDATTHRPRKLIEQAACGARQAAPYVLLPARRWVAGFASQSTSAEGPIVACPRGCMRLERPMCQLQAHHTSWPGYGTVTSTATQRPLSSMRPAQRAPGSAA